MERYSLLKEILRFYGETWGVIIGVSFVLSYKITNISSKLIKFYCNIWFPIGIVAFIMSLFGLFLGGEFTIPYAYHNPLMALFWLLIIFIICQIIGFPIAVGSWVTMPGSEAAPWKNWDK